MSTLPAKKTHHETHFYEHKFLCPKCGCREGYFGTFTYHSVMGKSPDSRYHNKGYKTGDSIGYCRANDYTGNGCDYEWVRNDLSDQKHFTRRPIT